MQMMRSLLASNRNGSNKKGRSSSPSVATPVNNVITSIPLGATDGTGYRVQGVISGIDLMTQAGQVRDYAGVLQYLAPKCYGIRGSRVVTNYTLQSNNFADAVWGKDNGCTVTGTNLVNLPNQNSQIRQYVTDPIAIGGNYVLAAELSGSGTIYLAAFEIGPGTVKSQLITLTETPTIYYLYRTSLVTSAQIFIYIMRDTDGTATKVNVGHFFGMVSKDYVPGILPPYIATQATPVTVCYDHLADGTPLRPFFSFSGTHRYTIFRPTELARNMVFNVGECIEAVASDGIRRYFVAKPASIADSFVTGTNLAGTLPPVNNGQSWVSVAGNFTISGGNAVIPASPTYDYVTIDTLLTNFTVVNTTILEISGQVGTMVKYGGGSGYIVVGVGANQRIDIYDHTAATDDFVLQTSFPIDALGITLDSKYVLEVRISGTTMDIFVNGIDVGTFTMASHLAKTGVGIYGYMGSVGKIASYDFSVINPALANGTTGATSPTFNPTAPTNDAGITWQPTGYATILGLDLAPTGSANHPEGVYATMLSANALTNDQIMCYDFFPDLVEDRQCMSTNAQVYSGWTIDHMQSYVGVQQRAGNNGKQVGRFTRSIIRMNATNHILYNDGAMFTGASGGGFTPNLVVIGAVSAAAQLTGCILNWFILKNAALNDAQATARSNFDLKPNVAALFDGGPELSNV